MTQSAQPPEETFCLNCGPDAVLGRHGGAVLHCPRCGIAQPVSGLPLFVVTGASHPDETAERIATWISRSMDDANAAPPASN